jgi:hypothetical protein
MSDEQAPTKKPPIRNHRGDNRGVRKMAGEELMKPTTVPVILDSDLAERLERLFSRIPHRKKRKFLAAYAICGQLRETARITGIDTRFHYMWKEKDPNYLPAFEEAKAICADHTEDEIFRRGIAGIDHPLSFKGKLTGDTIKQYSDLLAIFWMKGNRPEKYREDARLQINVNVPPAINIVSAIDVTDASIAKKH